MNPLGLSPAQVAARSEHIHAGHAERIMLGQWRSVWREIKGLDKPENLDDVLAVQMGSYTEPFNLWWCQQRTGRPIIYYSDNAIARSIWIQLGGDSLVREELRVSRPPYGFMACNLDGMTTTPRGHCCVIDAKHVGKLDEQTLLRYTPAGVHQATVMGVDWWALSLFIGNSRWEVTYQEVDPLYQAELIAKEREFWSFVERDIEPEDATPTLAPKPQPQLRQIVLSSEGPWRDNWAADFIKAARAFAETDAAAKAHAISRKTIGEILPEDVGLCRYGLVEAKRDRRGLTIALKKEENDGR